MTHFEVERKKREMRWYEEAMKKNCGQSDMEKERMRIENDLLFEERQLEQQSSLCTHFFKNQIDNSIK